LCRVIRSVIIVYGHCRNRVVLEAIHVVVFHLIILIWSFIDIIKFLLEKVSRKWSNHHLLVISEVYLVVDGGCFPLVLLLIHNIKDWSVFFVCLLFSLSLSLSLALIILFRFDGFSD